MYIQSIFLWHDHSYSISIQDYGILFEVLCPALPVTQNLCILYKYDENGENNNF